MSNFTAAQTKATKEANMERPVYQLRRREFFGEEGLVREDTVVAEDEQPTSVLLFFDTDPDGDGMYWFYEHDVKQTWEAQRYGHVFETLYRTKHDNFVLVDHEAEDTVKVLLYKEACDWIFNRMGWRKQDQEQPLPEMFWPDLTYEL